MADISLELCGLRMASPLMLASGILGETGPSLLKAIKAGAGAVVTKSIGMVPRDGYPNPTVVETECGLLNAIGLANPGIDEYIKELQAAVKGSGGVPVIGSIFAGEPGEFAELAKAMASGGASAVELNLSCPHAERSPEKMGVLLGQDPEACRQVVGEVRRAVQVPLIVKVTPQVANVMAVVRAVEQAGASAVTMTNRFMGFAVDIERAAPYTGSWAAVGGPWIAPLTLRWVAQCHRDSRLPILGSNGAAEWSDVVEFVMAGASLVQLVGRFMLTGPELIPRILTDLTAFMQRKGYGSIREMVGVAARAAVPYTELHRIPAQRMRLVSELCSDCGKCLHACYYGALIRQGEEVVVTDACVGCELCAVFCPTGALQVEVVGAGPA